MTNAQDQAAGTQLFAHFSLDGNALTARLVGPSVGQREAPIVSKAVQARLEESGGGLKFVVLDFADIGFINSMGIGACVEMHKAAKMKGATLILYGLQDELAKVFTLTKLDKLFKIVPDEKKLNKILKK